MFYFPIPVLILQKSRTTKKIQGRRRSLQSVQKKVQFGKRKTFQR